MGQDRRNPRDIYRWFLAQISKESPGGPKGIGGWLIVFIASQVFSICWTLQSLCLACRKDNGTLIRPPRPELPSGVHPSDFWPLQGPEVD